jgi:PAS domain S-box-containing protein
MSADAAPAPASPRGRRRGADADNFKLLADFAPVMIWVASPDRRCVYFNRPWIEFTGRDAEAELGFGWTDGVHPDDIDATLEAYQRAFENREPLEVEFRLRRHDGEYRWLIDKGVPLIGEGRLNGFVGSCLDITDRMVAERAARKREQDFQTLAENIPDVIARLDRRLVPVYVNRPLEQAFGAPPPGLPDAAARAFESATEQTFQFQSDARAERRHFEGRVIPERDAAGRIEGVLVIIYDVTARAREDEKREEILERERSARAIAESATLARDQFLAVVSHELRSPLNGIKSWTHVLENQLRDPDPTVRRALAGIMIGVEHQVRLIEDLLDVTRALSGNLGLAKQSMPLLPVLADAVESLRATALEKSLGIVTDYGIGELEVHGDPDRIRQIFVNLLANAVKFTPPGGCIWVSARTEEGMARVDVRDNGAGVPPEFLPYLFDPFRQADQASSRRSQDGLGLGLALVQRLAQLHGGYVTCESEGVGRGATFRVHLPLPRETPARVIVGRDRPGETVSSLPSLTGIRVLLIDDQREARESVAALLAQRGASVATAASCHEALAHLALADDADEPEIIVCDIAMPGEDGYATLKRIRAWEASRGGHRRARRPAVALSAFTQREDRIRALSEGFQMHLTKPVAPAELITVVSSVARGLRA